MEILYHVYVQEEELSEIEGEVEMEEEEEFDEYYEEEDDELTQEVTEENQQQENNNAGSFRCKLHQSIWFKLTEIKNASVSTLSHCNN